MPVTLTVNGQRHRRRRRRCRSSTPPSRPACACPTSCVTQGKCKECIVEVTRGHGAALAADRMRERISNPEPLPPVVPVPRRRRRRRGRVPHDAPRPDAHRAAARSGCRPATQTTPLDPAVTRDGDRIVDTIDRRRDRALDRPDPRPRDGPRHHDRRAAADRSRDRRAGRRRLVRESAALRRLGRDVAHPLRHRASGPAADAHARRLPDATRSRSSRSTRRRSTRWCVVGNSTMRDLFFRQSVYSIGQNPYRSITEIEMAEGKRTTTSLTTTGRRSLLPIHPNARVYGAADHQRPRRRRRRRVHAGGRSRARRAARRDHGHRHEHGADRRQSSIASSPRRARPGPAFEGGAIACGMPGLDGAIEDVAIDDDGTFRLGVIGGGAPEGICGSGLVDLLSELLRTGRMNELGRFEDGDRTDHARRRARHLFPRERRQRAGAGQGRQRRRAAGRVQPATASSSTTIDVFYLAGGFGRHLKTSGVEAHRADPEHRRRQDRAGRQRRDRRARRIALLSRSKREELESAGEARRALPARDAPADSSISSSTDASSGRWDRQHQDHR